MLEEKMDMEELVDLDVPMKEELIEEPVEEPAEAPVIEEEIIPSMDEFKDEIEQSFHRIHEGDILTGTIIGISDTLVNVDLGSYAEGIILPTELSDDPKFSMHEDLQVGDVVSGMVIREDDGNGNLVLSLRQAAAIVAWDILKQYQQEQKRIRVKISQAVNAGVVGYVEGVRGFIPASQLSLQYVENLEEWVGNTVEVLVIEVDEENRKLIMSAKPLLREQAQKEQEEKLNRLQKGYITKGIVERIEPYGCFVSIGEGLTGLVHISEMAWQRVQSPKDIVKLGDEVNVKVLEINDGKIRLSMKATTEPEDEAEDDEPPIEYSSGEEAGTSLGDLLKGITL